MATAIDALCTAAASKRFMRNLLVLRELGLSVSRVSQLIARAERALQQGQEGLCSRPFLLSFSLKS
jgi:hypothetical protein